MKKQASTLNNPKLLSMDEALKLRQALRALGKKVVITNGCFDLMHVGHLTYLAEAAALGDVFWVLLNGDQSVRALKGDSRPILSEAERAYALAALSAVDGVIVFNTKRLDNEIKLLEPDVYVKAGDYTIETLDAAERTALESVGSKVCFMPFVPGYSTTNLIKKIAALEKM